MGGQRIPLQQFREIKLLTRLAVHKAWLEYLEAFWDLSEEWQGMCTKSVFIIHHAVIFLFFTLILSWELSGAFLKLYDVLYYKRYSAEADVKIKLFSMKSEIKDFTKL